MQRKQTSSLCLTNPRYLVLTQPYWLQNQTSVCRGRFARPPLHGVSYRSTGPLKASTALHNAAVDEDRCRGEIARAISGEKPNHASDLLRPCHASQRYRCVQPHELGRILNRAEIYRGCHGAWTHSNHEDVVRGKFDTGGAREHAHAALGKAIRGVPGIGPTSCTELILMMRPPLPCLIICLAASCVPKKALFRSLPKPCRIDPRWCRGPKCVFQCQRCSP